jgi:hypothetical protein
VTKLIHIEGRETDLEKLYASVKDFLLKENFKIVKDDVTEKAYHLRAVKTHVTRIIIGAARDVEVVIAGDPNNYAVIVLVGAWGKNMAVSATAGFILASTVAAPAALAVGSVAAAGSYLTAKMFEDNLHDRIASNIAEFSS